MIRSFSRLVKRNFYSKTTEEDSNKLINTLIGINGAVFLGWVISQNEFQSSGGRLAEKYRFMHKHFVCSLESIDRQRYHTIITSFFSHNNLFHLFLNMFVLKSFGPNLCQLLGAREFLKLYFAGGISCSLGSYWYFKNSTNQSIFNIVKPQGAHLGASGAISACTMVWALTFPFSTVSIFGIIPVYAIIAVPGFTLLDAWRSSNQASSQGGVNYIGHVAGAAAGALFWKYKIGRMNKQRF